MGDVRDVLRRIGRSAGAAGDSLSELVRIPTVNPPGLNYHEIVGLLEQRCVELGMSTRVVDVPRDVSARVIADPERYPRMNLIARWDVGAAKTVHFNAHFDVVPADPARWPTDPFAPRIDGDWLYGRGSEDMKGSIAALFTAIRAIRDCELRPAVNVECSFTCDEETGGELGAGFIAREGLIDADFIVNCEGGGGLRIGCGHNGVIWMRVSVHGKSAHASTPEKGINAFEKMAQVALGLGQLKGQLAAKERVFVGPGGSERWPTINVGGVFHGTDGDKVNTVPGQAIFSIDRRVVPNERLEDAERELRRAIDLAVDAAGGPRVGLERALAIEPCVVPTSDAYLAAFMASVRRVRRRPVRLSTTSGFTDLHFLVGGGLPGVGYGPVGQHGHGADERVPISDVLRVAQVYADFVIRGL